MNVWVVINLVFWTASVEAQERPLFQASADPAAESPVFAGLDSAIAFTTKLAAATVSLLPGAFAISSPATIGSDLEIAGQGQVIVFSKSLRVCGALSIFNSILRSTMTDLPMVSLAGGSFLLSDSTVAEASAALAAGSGSVALEGSNFTSNSAPTLSILSSGASVRVLRCTVSNHSAEFLQVTPKSQSAGNIAISIDQTTFKENRGVGNLITYLAPLYTGSIAISNTNFALNSIPQLYLDIGTVQVSVVGCTFFDNSQTSLTLYANGAVLAFKDSMWKGNSQMLFDIRKLTGDFLATGITVTNQRFKGFFQVSNGIDSDQCRFTLQNSSFLDTYFKVNEFSPGVVYGVGCTVTIAQSLIKNVRMAAVHQRDIEGLLVVRVGNLVISGLTLESSGAVGFGIAAAVGALILTDSRIDDLQSGVNILLGLTSGSFIAHNVTVTQPLGFPIDDVYMGGLPFYFATMQAYLELRNIQILPGIGGYRNDDPITIQFTDVNISGVLLKDMHVDSLGLLSVVKGSISNVTIQNCTLGYAVLNVFSLETLHIAGMTVTDCDIGTTNKGIFGPSSSMFLNCTDFVFRNISTNFFISSRYGEVNMRNVSITDSHFNYFVYYQVASNITLEGLNVRRSTGGLAIFLYSSLHLIDSSFENFSSNTHMIAGDGVNITLEKVVMRDCFSTLSLCKLKDNSQLLINQSSFSKYQSLAEEGFVIDSGALTVIDTRFFTFNVVLFQLFGCRVSIQTSFFQEVKNKVLSEKSDSAFGGVLGCVDCTSVSVKSSSFLNISAIHGGALAIRKTTATVSPQVYINECEFVMCSAIAGGAIYLLSSSFLIESSRFLGNSATLTGGAVDAYTHSDLHTTIRNCVFQRNNAREGGGVKWKDSPISFKNITFQDNSAVYGPDIASFGIRIFGNLSSLSGAEASGYPLSLLFELQDHYGQRVSTASTQDFQLMSDSRVNYRGNQAATISQGVFNFSQLTIYAQPNSHQIVSGVMSYVENNKMFTLNGSIEIAFRDCVSGEVRKTDRCEYCFPGNVSFDPSESECSYCPKYASCLGGNELRVDSHYWRSSNHTSTLIKCPLKETCLGGKNSRCAEGYTGKVCNECSEDHTRIRTIECEYCGNRIIQWIKISLIAIPITGFYYAVRRASNIQLFILKQTINHAQLLSTLCYLRASYPTVLKYWFHILAYFSSLFITEFPISCFSRVQPESIRALIGSVATPMLCLLLILSPRKERTVMCTSALMFSPMISLYTQMPLLACQGVDSEVEWLYLDMRQECWQGSHLFLIKALIVPSVILNVLLPVLLAIVVSTASPVRFIELFPLWHSGLRWRCWDLLIYSAKGVFISLVAISAVAKQLSQVTYGLLVIVFASVVAVTLNGYVYIHWKLFFLVEYSLVIVAVSMGLSAYFVYHSPSEGATDWLITAAFLALNVGYFAVCVKLWRFPPNLADEKQEEVSPCEIIPPHNSIVDFIQASQEHS